MTTDELRDWHARRKYLADMPGLSQQCRDGWTAKHFRMVDDNELHPFPSTLDGAASAMPTGWEYWKIIDDTATGFTTWYWAGHPVYQTVKQLATGDEVHDRYALAKYAWEAMGPTK